MSLGAIVALLFLRGLTVGIVATNSNNEKRYETTYKDGKQNGPSYMWYKNGQKSYEGNFKDGKPDGLNTKLYENGQKEVRSTLKDGKMDGLNTSWYSNGQIQRESRWAEDKLLSAVVWKPNGEKCPETNMQDGNGVWVGYYEGGTDRNIFKDGERVED